MVFGETIVQLRVRIAMILALATAAPVAAQTLDGHVRVSETKTPLSGALLFLVADSSHKIVDSTRVDSAGVFYLDAMTPGRYHLEIFTPDVLEAAVFRAPSEVLSAGSSVERDYLVPLAVLVLNERQVEHPVRPKGVTIRPKYPTELRKQGVEGDVLAQFIVDNQGRVVTSSTKILSATRPEFADAVRQALLISQFYPAEVGGRAVNQVVHRKFEFHIGGF